MEFTQSNVVYCLDQLKRLDRDRFLLVLATPRAVATDLTVLYAFNLELAMIRDSVTESMLGLIRLQWWREAIDGIFAGAPRRHSVVMALTELVRRHPLRRTLLDRMIDARERDLDSTPPEDLSSLETYAAETSGNLMALTIEAAGLDSTAGDLPVFARHVGIAVGLVGTARAALHLARHRRVMLPNTVLQEAGVDMDVFFELKPQPELNRAVAVIAAAAREHLAAVRKLSVPRTARPVLLAARLATAQLHRLEHSGFDLFNPAAVENSPLDIWRLAATRILGR